MSYVNSEIAIFKLKNCWVIMENIFRIFIYVSFFSYVSCGHDIPIDNIYYKKNPDADHLYQKAVELNVKFHNDSVFTILDYLNQALVIDCFNPEYYGMKAKVLSELGMLDSALAVQEKALRKGAMNGEYFFQLGLFQAAKGMKRNSRINLEKSIRYQDRLLETYPDSLGAFFIRQAAFALLHDDDQLFMLDVKAVREQFPNRLLEIEMMRRFKPGKLIDQILAAQE